MGVLKILVVDDEPGIRSGVLRILANFHVTYPFMDEDYSFEISEAASGEEGIEKIEKDCPDIILLDNKLPGIQGVEVLEYIRKKRYDIVVAMITSYASLDVAIRATRDGATDFIPKPFTPQELKSSVENITKQFTLRAGPSYEYSNNSTINVDYQYISFKNDTGNMEVHRMFAGVDNRIIDALFVRGGFALDNHGNTSWTGGLGIYPFKQLSIDIGYQYNMFPEIQAEFGRSNLVTISISVIL